jgi:hypothetical protein
MDLRRLVRQASSEDLFYRLNVGESYFLLCGNAGATSPSGAIILDRLNSSLRTQEAYD